MYIRGDKFTHLIAYGKIQSRDISDILKQLLILDITQFPHMGDIADVSHKFKVRSNFYVRHSGIVQHCVKVDRVTARPDLIILGGEKG